MTSAASSPRLVAGLLPSLSVTEHLGGASALAQASDEVILVRENEYDCSENDLTSLGHEKGILGEIKSNLFEGVAEGQYNLHGPLKSVRDLSLVSGGVDKRVLESSYQLEQLQMSVQYSRARPHCSNRYLITVGGFTWCHSLGGEERN